MGASSTITTQPAAAGMKEGTGTAWRARRRNFAAPLMLAVAALVLILTATPGGLGVSPDSTQYLSAAEYLQRGDGLRVHWWEEGSVPLTQFPPGHAVAIAALASVGLTPYDGRPGS